MNAQNITVDDTRTPQQLIENTLVNSSCAAVSNSTGNGDTFRPGKQSFAYFNRNGSSFPFEEGVVLLTSTSQSAVGPFVSNANDGQDDNTGWGRDSDLDDILGITSVNTTVLEFDFIAYTSSLSFNYIFASNEYQYNYPCDYSDGFAFLIKETGTTDLYKNLAVLPNTNTPVSSVNIRPKIEPGVRPGGIAYTGCEASNLNYFNGTNGSTSPVNYAGQTVVMTAEGTVVAGKTYHVKLVIGDATIKLQNSAIFLEAGSFASKIVLGGDRTIATNNPACFGEKIILDSKLTAADYNFKWSKKSDPTVTLGTNSTFEVTDAGNYIVEATVKGTTCILSGQIKIEYAPEILSTNTTLLQCDADTDGITVFNLTKVDNIVKNNVAENLNKGYYESLIDAQAKTNLIGTPQNYTNKIPDQILFARIENQYGCFKIAEVKLQVPTTAIPDQNPIATCDGDDKQDGFYQFDFSAEVTPQISAGLPGGLVFNYYLNTNDALNDMNVLPNIFKNTVAFNQIIYAKATNGADCFDITPITLVVNTFDPPSFQDESIYLCKGENTTLTVATGFTSYLWSTGSTANFITVNSAGDYSVVVTDVNGCEKTKKFKVTLSEPALITETVVKDFSGVDNSVLIKYTGSGNYEFSLDGNVFQDDPLFTNVKPGIYNAIARDKNGCGLSNSLITYVLDYPRFFTPNGDGYNDLWLITNIDKLPDYKIYIFDRYGKFLKQMDQNSSGWNGLYNGQQLPADDYWFTLEFVDGKTVKGHFSLKR
ncbi:T9SS type B sorting domain-containing protein [Flavobacterium sp. AC]|uniref:T9SS type B sorting domain-containing protein n=1 Tax=Flavobacterium azizsancarii TaxID=2961580 RepID=A0ABT4W7G7_9FLAO|nr:T9SS type B sorting domain-containing protein [Flavobacterium azizsancarii]MDA6068478.1 T9SS type B sorting domain-containing protein [Flavobacterium azizsancarii]